MGYQPEGSLSSIVLFGYSNGGQPPTPPVVEIPTVYGPALSPAERRRWFGDFESPLKRAARRKTEEYLRRVEFGILPPEVKAEIVEKATVLVPEKTEDYVRRKAKINPDRIINSVIREMKSEIRQELEKRRIFRNELDDLQEEEDIVVISTYLLH
jgi:hypothetical protein